jgi:hypothetical protein
MPVRSSALWCIFEAAAGILPLLPRIRFMSSHTLQTFDASEVEVLFADALALYPELALSCLTAGCH